MEEKEESKIVFARDQSQTILHISQAISGKNGYYCLGCNKQMQAKKGELRFHHFSHDPKDAEKHGKCTYSDETYRHKLAKEILQMQKYIRVPAVYKFDPNHKGMANLIEPAKIIRADLVRNELVFFEDEQGKIHHTASLNWQKAEGRNFLIRPDVTFFDLKENPILLIELVATHKPDWEKISKIKALGIDCVQVLIPKDNEEKIAAVFKSSQNTKWLYNGKEAKSEYIHIPYPSDGGIPAIDEQQRSLFEESFLCRKVRVRNLVRSFNKCLRSESYWEIESRIKSEISRVEANTKGERERALEIQARIRGDVEKEFESENQLFWRRRDDMEREKSDVERRYQEEKERIEKEQREYRPACTEEIGRIEGKLEELRSRYPKLEADRGRIREEKARIELELRNSKFEIARIGEQAEELPNRIEREKEAESERFREIGKSLEGEFRERIQAIRSAMAAGDFRAVSKYSTRLEELFRVWGVLDDYISKCRDFKRLAKARKCFDGKNWKNWSIQKP